MRRISWLIILLTAAVGAVSWSAAQTVLPQENETALRAKLTELQANDRQAQGSLDHAANALDASGTLEGEARLRALTIAAAALALAEQEGFREQTLAAIAASEETLARAEARLTLAQERLRVAQHAVEARENREP